MREKETAYNYSKNGLYNFWSLSNMELRSKKLTLLQDSHVYHATTKSIPSTTGLVSPASSTFLRPYLIYTVAFVGD